jgi:hypothetical protein
MKYLLVLLLFISCTVQQDRKAIRRVKANIDLLNDVFYTGLKLHPCDNDTLYLPPIIDNTGVISSDTIKPKPRPGNCIPDTLRIETVKRFRDSIPYKVIDTQKIDILTDSINSEKRNNSFKDGQLTEKDKVIKSQKKENTILWIAISFLLAIVGVWVYFNIKKSFK